MLNQSDYYAKINSQESHHVPKSKNKSRFQFVNIRDLIGLLVGREHCFSRRLIEISHFDVKTQHILLVYLLLLKVHVALLHLKNLHDA